MNKELEDLHGFPPEIPKEISDKVESMMDKLDNIDIHEDLAKNFEDMRNTGNLITLTPPIDGVQYGINIEAIKEGEWYINPSNEIKQSKFDFNPTTEKKINFSTNPKDTRFPYLVMPSKEQEIKVGDTVLWHMEKNHTLLTSNHKSRFVEVKAINEKGVWLGGGWVDFKDIEQLPTNPAKYTQEQMEKAMFEVYKNGIRNPKDGKENFTEVSNRVFQFLSPTAKAVRVEMEELNLLDDKWVNNFEASFFPHLVEERKLQIKVETSSEYSQGIVKALEVI